MKKTLLNFLGSFTIPCLVAAFMAYFYHHDWTNLVITFIIPIGTSLVGYGDKKDDEGWRTTASFCFYGIIIPIIALVIFSLGWIDFNNSGNLIGRGKMVIGILCSAWGWAVGLYCFYRIPATRNYQKEPRLMDT